MYTNLKEMGHPNSLHRVNQDINDKVLPPTEKRLHLRSISVMPLKANTRERCARIFAVDDFTKDLWVFSSTGEPLRIPRDEANSLLNELDIKPSIASVPTAAKSRTEIQEMVRHLPENDQKA